MKFLNLLQIFLKINICYWFWVYYELCQKIVFYYIKIKYCLNLKSQFQLNTKFANKNKKSNLNHWILTTILCLSFSSNIAAQANLSINFEPNAKFMYSASNGFDTDWMVGLVFEDINQNGIQDANETGIPGVRLFTVTGLILETDGFGRFHLPVDTRKNLKEKKILIKLDISSLPEGYKVNSENPLLKSINFSMPVNFNFSVVKIN